MSNIGIDKLKVLSVLNRKKEEAVRRKESIIRLSLLDDFYTVTSIDTMFSDANFANVSPILNDDNSINDVLFLIQQELDGEYRFEGGYKSEDYKQKSYSGFPYNFNKIYTVSLSNEKNFISPITKNTKSVNIRNLKQPFKWETIKIIFSGDSIEIKQDDTNLGVYSLDDLKFPKDTQSTRGDTRKTLRRMFLCLHFINDPDNSTRRESFAMFLNSTDNSNNQLKRKLKSLLCGIFSTNIDPIRIQDGLYYPKFMTSLSKELSINRYRSGRSLTDRDAHTELDDFLESN